MKVFHKVSVICFCLLFVGCYDEKARQEEADTKKLIKEANLAIGYDNRFANKKGFDSLNIIILKKTGKDICTILDDIRAELHQNYLTLEIKHDYDYSEEFYNDLGNLDKVTIQKKIKKYGLSTQEYIQIDHMAIDICKNDY